MNNSKLLHRIVRRQVEAIAQTISEAELSGEISPTDAQALRVDAKRIFEMVTGASAEAPVPATCEPRKQEKEIMQLIAEVLGVVGMENGNTGALWRMCIRGSQGHPPRPGKVRRVFETLRSELAGGKVIDNPSKYAWWLYKQFAD